MISGTLSAAETNYNVLFIQSYTNSSSWHNNLIAGLQDGLEEGGVKANVVIEYLNADFLDVCFGVCHHAPHMRTCQTAENGFDCDVQR